MECVGTAVGTDQVGNVSDTRNGDGEERIFAHLTNSQLVVDRAKLFAMKGDLGRSSA